jgi:hypothetical protein
LAYRSRSAQASEQRWVSRCITCSNPESLARMTLNSPYVRLNVMRAAQLQDALERLTAAIRDVESELAAMKAEHDPLASHIFVARRYYRNANDTKSGKRREMMARLSFNTACELGFRGSLDEWGTPHGSSCEAVNDCSTAAPQIMFTILHSITSIFMIG